MNTIFDVARYYLNSLGDITTMKLQKLCYYAQAWSLAWDGEPLFNEDFQAWANGPVCPELFQSHAGIFKLKPDFFDGHKCEFSQEQNETLNAIREYYGDKPSQWLSELSHKEAPWKIARENTPVGERCTNVITKDSMQEYYSGLASL